MCLCNKLFVSCFVICSLKMLFNVVCSLFNGSVVLTSEVGLLILEQFQKLGCLLCLHQ